MSKLKREMPVPEGTQTSQAPTVVELDDLGKPPDEHEGHGVVFEMGRADGDGRLDKASSVRIDMRNEGAGMEVAHCLVRGLTQMKASPRVIRRSIIEFQKGAAALLEEFDSTIKSISETCNCAGCKATREEQGGNS